MRNRQESYGLRHYYDNVRMIEGAGFWGRDNLCGKGQNHK
jgi:hypothetical protein